MLICICTDRSQSLVPPLFLSSPTADFKNNEQSGNVSRAYPTHSACLTNGLWPDLKAGETNNNETEIFLIKSVKNKWSADINVDHQFKASFIYLFIFISSSNKCIFKLAQKQSNTSSVLAEDFLRSTVPNIFSSKKFSIQA